MQVGQVGGYKLNYFYYRMITKNWIDLKECKLTEPELRKDPDIASKEFFIKTYNGDIKLCFLAISVRI